MQRRRKDPSPDLFTLRCEECGQPMITTESGYLCCPNGHGALYLDDGAVVEEPCSSWFDTTLED